MSITVRPTRLGDKVALETILWDTFESTWRPQVTAQAAQAFRDEAQPAVFVYEKGQAFWVAERDGEVAGLVYRGRRPCTCIPARALGRRACQGVGAALMDLAEARMAADGQTAARLETDTFNTRSQAFYAARSRLS